MNIYKVIEKRRSIRKYETKKIEEDKLNRILNAARLAPSARNIQCLRLIVVRDEKTKEDLVDACRGQSFIAEADCIIAVAIDEEECYQGIGGYMSSFAVDAAIALDHLILAAGAECVGTCWIGAFKEDSVKKVLKVPGSYRVVALTPLGYPAEEPPERRRKTLQEIVSYDTW